MSKRTSAGEMAGISMLTRYPSKLHSAQSEANRSAKKGSNLSTHSVRVDTWAGVDWIHPVLSKVGEELARFGLLE